MDLLVQCPVCTLYLHNGMTLESHLDTHPKDQVIKALCSLTTTKGSSSSYGSRTSTPLHSERSYRSRSRTPATDDRWPNSHRSSDNERYWRRTPSRTSKSSQMLPMSRNGTPDIRIGDINFENNINSAASFSASSYPIKSDKTQQTYSSTPTGPVEFEQPYAYYQDSSDDREIKYSRSAEYNPMDSNSAIFTHKSRSLTPGAKLQSTFHPAGPGTGNDNLVKMLPKPNNILVKTNMGGVQYMAPGVKPMHVMVSTAPTFVQKNVQSSMVMTGGLPGTTVVETKTVGTLPSNQFSQLSSSTFTPGTTVVQNSQFIYREMVHNIDGKRFISCVPSALSHENVTNVAQGTSMYQNLMVVDQLRNAPCLYTTPQAIITKPCAAPVYGEGMSHLPSSTTSNIDKAPSMHDVKKTLIIEVGPIVPPSTLCEMSTSRHHNITTQTDVDVPEPSKGETLSLEKYEKSETPGSSKGLKILSNIKVEVPVQHHKNMLNTVMDLTGSNESEYPVRSVTPEKILPDLDDNNQTSNDCTQPSISSSDSVVPHTFSVIKNIGNPPCYKDSPAKSSGVDSKLETESSDSCPVPDLICNEKPSISPCSELSENGENSTDRTLISTSASPSPQASQSTSIDIEKRNLTQPRLYKNNTLRLNNIYVKKNKKVLQIKNAKPSPACTIPSPCEIEPKPSSSTCRSPEYYTMSKIGKDICDKREKQTLQTISVERIDVSDDLDNHDFDADTEEQSMDIEPVAPSKLDNPDQFTTSIDVVQVKEEVNTSNEDGYSNENSSNRDLTSLKTLRPINVITYGNMPPGDFDDESNHRELLELEAASKNNKFVNMINENYFGDNIYADYFTPDRVESFDSERESSFPKEGPKDGMYGMWGTGEPSHKESEFVLPNFIHESYKIAESSGVDYSDVGNKEGNDVEEEGCERDCKADVMSESRSEGEAPMNICADERMPPRGELSGQESNGDTESPWMYTDVPPAEPYDLIARESWVSDGSEMDSSDKRDNLEEELKFPKGRSHICSTCGCKFPSLREMRAHKAQAHSLPILPPLPSLPPLPPLPPPQTLHPPLVPLLPLPTASRTTYSRMLTEKIIKKEEKVDETTVLAGKTMLAIDSKDSIATTMPQVYDIPEAKPKIERLIKQEPKQRKKRDFICPTCKQDQVTEVAFHAHLKIHPLECLTCGKCFFRRANLALHIKTHLGIKNFKCEVCEKRFITRQKLQDHSTVHTGRTPVKCTVCDDTFRRYSNMLAHRNRHHFRKKAKVRDYVCHCGAVFHSRAKLLWHQETHDDKPKACLYCSDKFVHAASLTRHVRRTHNMYYTSERGKPKENVPCPHCKQMYLRSNLRAHLLTHSGKRPHVCMICNKSFTTKWNLKLHRWTHMSRSAKPFKCHLCKGAFIRHAEFVSHMNSHKSVRPYTCNYCGCKFIRKYNCQRHVREHQTAKKYVCKVPECGKSFHRSYYLSEHMKVHSGARPFACNICGKTSSNKSNHNKHLKIHHAREPVATEA